MREVSNGRGCSVRDDKCAEMENRKRAMKKITEMKKINGKQERMDM